MFIRVFFPLGNKDVAIFEFRELAQGNDENIITICVQACGVQFQNVRFTFQNVRLAFQNVPFGTPHVMFGQCN
jgi:hypothetical protein